MPVDARRGDAAGAAPDFGAAALPGVCAVCRSWGRGRVCRRCIDRFAAPVQRCRRCALPLTPGIDVCGTCLAAPPPFDRAVAAVDYGAPWDALVTAFKFRGALDLASTFAALIARRVPSDAGPPTLVVPVPLAARRLRERGYNQAWELARRIARALRVRAEPRLLVRLRETEHQLDLPPSARAANVRDAFALEPRRRADVAGARVAVVDDVMTTGTTLAEVAAVLARAGAASVEAWVFARTPSPRDDG